MAETVRVKVLQKMKMDVFKRLNDQVKNGGVQIILSQNPSIEYIGQPKVLGQVGLVFNLGQKLEVEVPADLKHGTFHFKQIKNVFFLAKIDE